MSNKWLHRMMGVSGSSKDSKDSGFTIVEIGLVVILGTILGILALFYYNSYRGDAKIDEMQKHVQTITASTQKLYYQHPTYTGLALDNAIDAGLIPLQLVNGNSAVNPWGGDLDLEPNTDDTKFDLSTEGVPQKACIELISLNFSQDNGSIVAITVNGGAVALPINPAAAAGACDSEENDIVWTVE